MCVCVYVRVFVCACVCVCREKREGGSSLEVPYFIGKNIARISTNNPHCRMKGYSKLDHRLYSAKNGPIRGLDSEAAQEVKPF